MSILDLIAVFVAILLVSGNNISACVGTAIGSGVLSRKFALGLGATGFAVGLVSQGQNMVRTAQTLLPNSDQLSVFLALLAIILLFSFGKIIRVPLSVTMSLVGLLIGVSFAKGAPFNQTFVASVVAMWFVAPIAAIVAVYFLVREISKSNPDNLWSRIRTYKILLIILSFLCAFVVGGNSVSLIVAVGGFDYLTVGIGIVAIYIGSFYLSTGQIKRVGQDLFLLRYSNALATLLVSTVLFEIATLLAIPLSSTQTLTSGIYGAAISYGRRYISLRPFFMIILGWVIAPLASFAIGFLL